MKSSKNSRVRSAACATRRICHNLFIATTLSLLIAPLAQLNAKAQTPAPSYIPLNAVQLDQLVAPIALDPDPLVAQILTGSTFPDQVGDADNWLNQNMNLGPDQRASQANTMSWDASIKGLIAFPAVLDSLAKNSAWTTQLGNAYFNQPGDVMNAIQAMRLQAQQAHILVTTVQENVVVDAGVIEILPANPALVYVPYYNPWHIWGSLFVAYPGYDLLPPPAGIVVTSAVAFEPAINVGVYGHFGWGFSSWSASWGSGTVQCNHSTYVSQSHSVSNHGNFGSHDSGAFEHGGRGVPNGYHAAAQSGSARSVSISKSMSISKSTSISNSKSSSSSHASSSSRSTSNGRSASGTRSNSTDRSTSGSRSTSNARSTSSTRSNSTARSTSGSRSTSNARSTSSTRSNSTARSTSGSRSTSPGRSMGRNQSTGHMGSLSARSGSYGHSTSSRSASTGRSPGAGRSASAGRSTSQGRAFNSNRSMGQARSSGGSRGMGSAAGRSFGAGRSASAGRSMGGNRPMSRPASMGRSSGFGGGRMGGGRRR
ncbi:MAG: DUF3300 domain-containing protein [Terracidiphilus sp.]|jgi:hypothetical protein